MTAELTPVVGEDEVYEGAENPHVLVLGDEVFSCAPDLPMSTLIRYADNDLLSLHHILVKLVNPDDLERMWDAFETLGTLEVNKAIGDLVASYSDRPTKRPSPSPAGSRSTRRR